MVRVNSTNKHHNEKFLARSLQNKDRIIFLGNLKLLQFFLHSDYLRRCIAQMVHMNGKPKVLTYVNHVHNMVFID